MPLTSSTWPICAALLQFPAVSRSGQRAQDAPADRWHAAFTEIADAGFAHVEIADSWVNVADLSPPRRADFGQAASAAGIGLPSATIVRRSVIDPESGADNLKHAHQMIDAAAELGSTTVCAALHRPLTPDQQRRLWFWTGEGAVDPDDAGVRAVAVNRFRELGQHAAEVGMVLALELYEDTYLGTSSSAVRLVEDIGLRNVGLNPDIGNLVRLHRDIESWWQIAETTLPYANYWHVKNYARDEHPETGLSTAVPAYLEVGMINYREAISYALSVGFQGVICCEHYGGDGLSVSAANQGYLRRILPKDEKNPLSESRVSQPVLTRFTADPARSQGRNGSAEGS